MKKFLIGLLVLFALLLAGVLIAPGLINWNQYKPELAALAKEHTGRDIKVTGDISATLLPTPRLEIAGLELAGVDGGKSPHLLRVKKLEVVVELMPLLSRQVKVDKVFVEGLVLVLERLADGRNNWSFDQLAGAGGNKSGAPGGKAGGDRLGFEISLRELIIRNGEISYLDGAGGGEQRVENLQLVSSIGSLNGPFSAQGSVTARGISVHFDGNIGKLGTALPVPIDLTLSIAGVKGAKLAFQGNASLAKPAPGVAGKLLLEADNVAALVAALAPKGAAAFPLAQALKLTADIEADAEAAKLEDIRLELAGSRIEGRIVAGFGAPTVVAAELTVKNLNLDKLLAAAANTKAPVRAEAKADESQAAPIWPELPTGVNGTLALKADGVTLRGGLVRQGLLKAELKDGRLTISDLRALLPSGSDVKLSGVLAPVGESPRMKARLEAGSSNLRGLLSWLGIDLNAPAGRLSSLTVTADVVGKDRILLVPNLKLRLDATSINGSASYRLQKNPSFGLNLAVDRVNLDGYLPLSIGGEGRSKTAEKTPPAAAIGGAVKGFERFDADVKLSIKQLTYQRKSLRGLRFDAQLYDGVLNLRDVGIANIGGGALKITGRVKGLNDRPVVDLKLVAKAKNLGTVAKFLAWDPRVPSSRLNNFSLDIALKGDSEAMRFSGDARLSKLKLSFDALSKAPMKAPRLDAKFKLSHPSLTTFSRLFGLPLKPKSQSDGPISVSGSLKGGLDVVSLDLRSVIAGGTLSALGNVSNLVAGPAFKLTLDVRHKSIARMFAGLGFDYRAIRKGGHPLQLSATVEGNPGKLVLKGLNGVLGQTRIEGNLNVDLSRARPYLKANLKLGDMLVNEFIAKPASRAAAKRPTRGEARWSREFINNSGLRAADADIDIVADRIRYDNIPLLKPLLTLKLRNGVLRLSPMTASLFDGTLSADVQLKATSKSDVRVDLKLDSVQLRPALSALSGLKNVSGNATLSGNLQTGGRSEWELIRGLNGTITQRAWDGAIEGMDLKRAGKAFKNLDNLPLALVEISASLQGGRTRFLEIKGDWVVRRGIATTKNIASDFELGYGVTYGQIDLPRWRMDLMNDIRFSRDHENPDFSVQLYGPLDAPRHKLKTDLLKKGLSSLITGVVGGDGVPAKPEDLLKKGLESLLGKGGTGGSGSGGSGAGTTTGGGTPAPLQQNQSDSVKAPAEEPKPAPKRLPRRTEEPAKQQSPQAVAPAPTEKAESPATKTETTKEERRKARELRREERKRKREEKRRKKKGAQQD